MPSAGAGGGGRRRGSPGRRPGISRPALSGGLRGSDGDDAAGIEFLQLPQQVFLAGLGGLAAGVEIGAGFLVRLAGLEDGVGDLEESMRDRDDRPFPGALVLRAAELADQAMEFRLQPAGGADRGPGGLDQQRLDVAAAVPGPPAAALAGADV